MKIMKRLEKVGTHFALHNDEEQRANLEKLADYLSALPRDYSHFHMNYYFATGYVPGEHVSKQLRLKENHFEEHINECGTVACALGHGPLAGINPGTDTDWDSYGQRVFGYSSVDHGSFFFGMEWKNYDNTAHGAANRIYYGLQHGIPYTWEYNTPIIANHVNA